LRRNKSGRLASEPLLILGSLGRVLTNTAAVKAAASAGGNLDGLKADGDPYGIVYTGTPAA